MIGHDHFICHSYSHFSVLSHILLSDRTLRSGRSLMTSSDSVSTIISCCFSFTKVILPLTKASMAALTIFTAVFAYADLMWPLIANTDLN